MMDQLVNSPEFWDAVDTAIKIGLGAVVGGLLAWAMQSQRLRHERKKWTGEKRTKLIEQAADHLGELWQAQSVYWQERRAWRKDYADWFDAAGGQIDSDDIDHSNEKWASKNQPYIRDMHAALARAHASLLLCGQKKLADRLGKHTGGVRLFLEKSSKITEGKDAEKEVEKIMADMTKHYDDILTDLGRAYMS
jgi:hypothetical protein